MKELRDVKRIVQNWWRKWRACKKCGHILLASDRSRHMNTRHNPENIVQCSWEELFYILCNCIHILHANLFPLFIDFVPVFSQLNEQKTNMRRICTTKSTLMQNYPTSATTPTKILLCLGLTTWPTQRKMWRHPVWLHMRLEGQIGYQSNMLQ